jgi:CDP-paratose 2-epimerase
MPKDNILLTGGFGFVGTNLLLDLKKKYNVYIVDNFYKKDSKENFKRFQNECYEFYKFSITNSKKIEDLFKSVKFKSVINLAAQVAMTKSVENPMNDFKTNVVGTINLLEALRKFSKDTMFFNISSNKVYGDMEWDKLIEKRYRYESIKFKNGYDETVPLDFSGPYGCSKGSAEQYVLNYSKIYNLQTVSFRLSTIYGVNQYSTYDQGWIGWFINEMINNQSNDYNLSVHGSGKQVRDILYVDDFVNLIQSSLINFEAISGNVYNIGGGYKNSMSILELVKYISNFKNLNPPLEITHKDWRTADQKFYCSNIEKIKKDINWEPSVNKEDGLIKYFDWLSRG